MRVRVAGVAGARVEVKLARLGERFVAVAADNGRMLAGEGELRPRVALQGKRIGLESRRRIAELAAIVIGRGGELAAMVIVDTIVRLIPGVLGDEESSRRDSFAQGVLGYPQYTRPPEFRGMKVPEVLLSGDHGNIAEWRAAQARLRGLRVLRRECSDPGSAERAELGFLGDRLAAIWAGSCSRWLH